MNWLLNNPISEMPGPLFLGLYAVVIVLVVAEARWRSIRVDRSMELGPEPIPTKPDPVEIAYLRGGENEVTRLVVFDLIRRGCLRVEEKHNSSGKVAETRIARTMEHREADKLSPMEVDALDYFMIGRKPEALFQAGGLASRLKRWSEPEAERLREAQLLSPWDRHGAAWRNWLGGAPMILAFGGFKFAVAMSKGKHNIAFLVIFTIVGLIALAIACKVPRLTRRGKDYMARLREAFEGLKPRLAEPAAPGTYDPALVLVPAVFGVAALTGTPYAYAPGLFKSTAGTGGGGGGCGGGGGGCGGGGGGCGGGGCGGCGGCGGG